MNKVQRQSNFEMLRIISMILIVMSHCDDIFGLADLYGYSFGINTIITDWFHIGGQIGVGCFILISGYFMVEQQYSNKKLLKLVGEVWFYSISIWVIWMIYNFSTGNVDIKAILVQTVYAFFPILFSHYWFATAYVILLILSPFLNKFIFSLSERNYCYFLLCILGLFVLLPGSIPLVFSDMFEGRLVSFLVIYFIAGYLRRFGDFSKKNSSRHFLVAFIAYITLFTTFYCITFVGMALESDMIIGAKYFYRVLNSPLIVIICVELFIGFRKYDIKYNKIINTLAGCTFGIYLLHGNRIVLDLLPKLFPIYKEKNSFFILIYSILSMIVIYSICTLIDFIRQKTIGRIWIKMIDRYLEPIEKKIVDIFKKIAMFIKRVLKAIYQ